jgi:hypothetical protein
LSIEIDKNDTVAWMIINRFLEAHIKCGYVTPIIQEEVEPVTTLDIPVTDLPIEE